MKLFGLHWLGGLLFDEWITSQTNRKKHPECDIFVDFEQINNQHINVIVSSQWRTIKIGPFATFSEANNAAVESTKSIIMAHPKIQCQN